MSGIYPNNACLFMLGCTLLLFNTTVVIAASCELEDRISALEKQGRDHVSTLLQQDHEIQRLNTELEIAKGEIQKYKQQTHRLTNIIQQYQRTIIDQDAILQNYGMFIKQNRKLNQYKTEETLNKDNQLTQNQNHAIRKPAGVVVDKLQVTQTESHDPDGMIANTAERLKNNQSTSSANQKSDQVRILASFYKGTPTQTQKRLASDGQVAFHATTDKGIVSHIGINQLIALDVVLLNIGSGYRTSHGIFTAPLSGVYSFSASILSVNVSTYIQVNLVKNGLALGRAYAHGEDGRYGQGSITVLTQLAQGDEVWVADNEQADASYFGYRYTSFSGYLIFQT